MKSPKLFRGLLETAFLYRLSIWAISNQFAFFNLSFENIRSLNWYNFASTLTTENLLNHKSARPIHLNYKTACPQLVEASVIGGKTYG